MPALLSALRERLPEPARSHLHSGATSQDIVDTALMLVAREALAIVLADLDRAVRACADLADGHRDTLMAGRTLLQDALPETFGLKAANWLIGLQEARSDLAMSAPMCWRPSLGVLWAPWRPTGTGASR